MASADATWQAIWLKLLLLDLGFDHSDPIPILNDNQVAIAHSKIPVHHQQSKHIALRHHSLRKQVEDKSIALNHVPSAENIADLLTKALPRSTFEKLWQLLRFRGIGELQE